MTVFVLREDAEYTMFATTFSGTSGRRLGAFPSRITMSAYFPGSIEPMEPSMPIALAPPTVQKSRSCWAGATVASHLLDFCSRPRVFISANISSELLVLLLSVPTDTLAPLCRSSGSGATPPVASFMFDTAHSETEVPAAARSRTSFMVSHAEWAAMPRSESAPTELSHSAGRMPVFLLWSFTSPLVSERWKFSGARSSSESSLAAAQVSSPHTYTPCRPTPGTIFLMPLCEAQKRLQFCSGLPFWVVNSSSRQHQQRTPRMPASRTALAMTSSE